MCLWWWWGVGGLDKATVECLLPSECSLGWQPFLYAYPSLGGGGALEGGQVPPPPPGRPATVPLTASASFNGNRQ